MKTKLNLLCLCVIISLALSASMAITTLYQMVSVGFSAGWEAAQKGTTAHIPNYTMILTMPTDLLAKTGTVTNTMNGTEASIKPIISMVEIPKVAETSGLTHLGSILSFLQLIGFVFAAVQFFKLIRNINRGNIFEWKNVKYLRKLGWGLVTIFITYFGSLLITNHEAAKVISLNGCELSMSVAFTDPTLILGFASLLIAEVFAVGLRMKEEQELTI